MEKVDLSLRVKAPGLHGVETTGIAGIAEIQPGDLLGLHSLCGHGCCDEDRFQRIQDGIARIVVFGRLGVPHPVAQAWRHALLRGLNKLLHRRHVKQPVDGEDQGAMVKPRLGFFRRARNPKY